MKDVDLQLPFPAPPAELVRMSTHGKLAEIIGYKEELEVPAHHGWVDDKESYTYYPLEALRRYVDETRRPYRMNPDVRDIMYRRGLKFGREYIPKGWVPRIFSIEEAIQGGDFGYGRIDPMVLNTSAGHVDKRTGTKKDFITKNPDGKVIFIDPVLRRQVKDAVERLVQGVPFYFAMEFRPSIMKMATKVETRPPGKLPRATFGVSAAEQIAWRVFTMEISEFRKRVPVKFGSGVGINPHSADWDALWARINGRNVLNIDVKRRTRRGKWNRRLESATSIEGSLTVLK